MDIASLAHKKYADFNNKFHFQASSTNNIIKI